MGSLPKVTGQAVITVHSDDGTRTEVFVYEGDVPEEVMDAYEEIVGNGLAEVTISVDKASKDFGTGTSAMVGVRLTCNQDGATLIKAAQLAAEFARTFAEQQRKLAQEELQKQLQGPVQQRPNYGR